MKEKGRPKKPFRVPSDKVLSRNRESDIVKLNQEDTIVAIDRNALIDSEK